MIAATTQSQFCRPTPLTLVALCLFSIAAPSGAQDAVTRNEIIKAWKDRQERVRSAEFEWTAKRFDTRGSISLILGGINPNMKGEVPPLDTTLTELKTAGFSGNKLRYDRVVHNWFVETKGYEATKYLSVFDGQTCKTLDAP